MLVAMKFEIEICCGLIYNVKRLCQYFIPIENKLQWWSKKNVTDQFLGQHDNVYVKNPAKLMP